MTTLTIAGQSFDVSDDQRIHEGASMSAGMAASLQQTRRENIRNNFAKRVKDAVDSGWNDEKQNELQSALGSYAESYDFGVRTAGTGTVRVSDPVEREARDEAKKIIANMYYAKTGAKVSAKEINEVLDAYMEKNGEALRNDARQRIADREKASSAALEVLGLAAE